MKDIKSIIGRNIRILRKNIGWKIETLAEESNISVSFLSAIELGNKNVSVDVVARIASALGVGYEQLFLSPKSTGNVTYEMRLLERELQKNVAEAIRETFRAPK